MVEKYDRLKERLKMAK